LTGGQASPRGSEPLSSADLATKSRLNLLSQVVRGMRGRQWRVVPHPGPIGGEQHTGGRSGALRAAIFGVNDGLVSNVSLIFGVAGAGVDNQVVILAGIAGLLAGAFSMGAGEYISVRVQREVFERLIHLADRLATELMKDPAVALETHAREELGLDPEMGLGSPVAAASASFVTFASGALLPLLPFLFASGGAAILASAALSGAALFGVGAAMTYLTARGALYSGTRMLAIGAAAAAITYLVGKALDVGVGV
jgi:vacuolar iron transporter family protein